ncbi:MSCRAMM family collagen-binding adhesin EcbA [Enterococcus hulanensis]|nr:MSCRAMM family collagen-binding adhesin EcbA [Enterococcus hulanensis]
MTVLQLLASLILPIVAQANINYPDQVSVEYDIGVNYRMRGKKANGEDFETFSSPLFAVSGNNRTPLFCIEPGMPIYGPSSPGFIKNPLPDMSQKAKLISALWSEAGENADTRMAAQAMLWKEVNNYSITESTNLTSNQSIDLAGIQNKINQVITDYMKKPSFDNATVNVDLGKSVTISDQNNSNLNSFDRMVKNTANVDYKINGNQLIITPKEGSKPTGELVFEKSTRAGTPVAYKKAGEQTVMAGAIDQTNQYTVKINVEKNGKVKIVKRDKESGNLVPDTTFALDFQGVRPNEELTTGKDGTAIFPDVPHGTTVIIKEKSVPAPYVIDETPLKAVIKAGETIEVTSRNTRAKGQILIDKVGQETNTSLWNEHYSLEGNHFDIRRDTPDGPIVQTIVTDEKGHAETPKAHDSALELGTYFVVESKASNGFVNTFKPVKVDLKYKNQTVSLVFESVKGANQEITGESTLTKIDKDTNDQTQGSAVFEGAEYSLFYNENISGHEIDEPVRWDAPFKPVLLKGSLSENPVEKEAITLVIDEDRQVGVKHLAVGKYYWKETKAPVGYTEDQTKYEFEIKKKDDSPTNSVIVENVTAKEQVIRFGFDFFKFANSSNGSASAGFNDLEFKLTPLEGTNEITGTDDTSKTQHHEGSGFDGYGKFENVPIGDYLFEEVEAPKGFQKIQPIEIRSKFEENEDDYKKSEYVFTLTEFDQKEPIKIVKIPYDKLTNESFSVSLNRIILYDFPIEKNQLTSLATWINDEKVLKDSSKGTIIDTVSYKLNQKKDDWYLVSQLVDVEATKAALEKDKDAEPIILNENISKQKNNSKTGTWEIEQKIDPLRVNGKTLVLFNTLYESEAAFKEGDEPVAVDNNLENQAQTLKVKIDNVVKIKTRAHLEKEDQTFTHGDILSMYDDVEITHSEIDGAKETFETILVALFPDGKTEEVWKSDLIVYVVEDEKFTKTVVTEKVDTGKYPKGTLFTFMEINYDKDGEVNATHNEELDEKSQTLYPIEEEKPEVPAKPNETQSSSVTSLEPSSSIVTAEKNLPQTGENMSPLLIVIGAILILVVIIIIFIHYSSKDS